MTSLLNINIGVLGHVDSGKTSLAKALSTTASTACFDKNPQSKERGITLDLGFSSFQLPEIPDRLQNADKSYTGLQFTLVDCPGHASLIKTIIGGAQIIDLMMLVVDIGKGIQTQTAECIVIGEITCNKLIVVLNKTDTVPEAKRSQTIEKVSKRILRALEPTKFKGAPIVSVAANPEGAEESSKGAVGIDELISALVRESPVPERLGDGDFIFAVDHCFGVRGQGTVMTGTVLSGSVRVGDTVEISALKTTKKVKSMQMFRKPVEKASQGDRLGLCVTQFDPSLLERGLVCTPGALPTLHGAILHITPISYHKGPIASKSKFHLTLGHETVMARVLAFCARDAGAAFSLDADYAYLDETSKEAGAGTQFLLAEFERPVVCARGAVAIGSRLDSDPHAPACRIAFHGRAVLPLDEGYRAALLPRLKVFKEKRRAGAVERAADPRAVIVKGLFKKETNMEPFAGLRVSLSSGQAGVVEGSFGQSGKCKVRLHDDLPEEVMRKYGGGGRKKAKETAPAGDAAQEPITVTLNFKRYIFDPKKRMVQT